MRRTLGGGLDTGGSALPREERWFEERKGRRYTITPKMQHRVLYTHTHTLTKSLRFMHYEKGSTSLRQHPPVPRSTVVAPGVSITSFLPTVPTPNHYLCVSSLHARFPAFFPLSRFSFREHSFPPIEKRKRFDYHPSCSIDPTFINNRFIAGEEREGRNAIPLFP